MDLATEAKGEAEEANASNPERLVGDVSVEVDENEEKGDGVGLATEAEGVGDLLEVENTLLPFTAAKGELADAYDMNPPYEMDLNRHGWL